MTATVSEIGANGCFIHMAIPLFKKALIELVILKGQEPFQSWGEVVYTQEAIGMGINFFRPETSQVKTLEGWIANLNVQQRNRET